MNKDLWQLAESIFDQSAEIDRDRRPEFINNHTADDPALRRLVEHMCAAELDASFMNESPEIQVGEVMQQDGAQNFGHYLIAEKVATGGMGRIYKAQRVDADVVIWVALKLIRKELVSEAMRQRFNNEKQILGKLKHHHIAALVDAGVIDGSPYIATEWVAGLPIDQWVAAEQPGLNQVLGMFLQVCEAVAYAHNQLVVHRDLKPANILVDGNEQVKLLDFGIAKLLDVAPGNMTQTQVFTPDYAAPEQINGEACTAATDIYALGLLLFELLVGKKRFALEDLSVADKIKQIAAPKTVFASQEMAKLERPGAQRVKGALDQVINQAIHPDPNRRYRSVYELITDIKRFQQHLPIQAMGDGWLYRSQMFLKRHLWSSLLALITLLSLLGGLLYSDFQKSQAQRAQQQAQLEADKSQQMLNFFMVMLESASPLTGGSTQITVQEMFEQGSDRFDINQITDPALRAEIAGQVAEVYGDLSANDLKIQFNQVAIEYYQTDLAQHASAFLSQNLGIAIAYRDQNQYEAALEHLTAAYEQVKDRELDQRLMAQVWVNFAEFNRSLNHADQALDYLAKAEVLAARNDDVENLGKVKYYQYLLLQNQLPPAESEVYLTQALHFFQQAYTGSHPNIIGAKNSMAIKLKGEGRYLEAADLYTNIHQEYSQLYGNKNHNQLINHADTYFYLGQFEQTVQMTNEALQVIEDNQVGVGISLMAASIIQARAWLELGRIEEAEPLLQKAMTYFADKLAPDHVLRLTLDTYWLDFLLKSDRIDELDQDVEQLVQAMGKHLNDANDIKRRYVQTLMVVATYHWSVGHYQMASGHFETAHALLQGITLKQEWYYWLIAAGVLELKKQQGLAYDSQQLQAAISQLNLFLPADHWYHGFFQSP